MKKKKKTAYAARNSCTESKGGESSDSWKEIDRGGKKKKKLVGKE